MEYLNLIYGIEYCEAEQEPDKIFQLRRQKISSHSPKFLSAFYKYSFNVS